MKGILKMKKIKKDKIIKFRISEKDEQKIRKKAKENDLTVSQYIRKTMMNANAANTKSDKKVYARLYVEYREWLNNISEEYGIDYKELYQKGMKIWEQNMEDMDLM